MSIPKIISASNDDAIRTILVWRAPAAALPHLGARASSLRSTRIPYRAKRGPVTANLHRETPPTNAMAAECPRRPPSLPSVLDLDCYASAATARFAVSRSPNLGTGPEGRWLLGALGFGQSGLCENLHYKPRSIPAHLKQQC